MEEKKSNIGLWVVVGVLFVAVVGLSFYLGTKFSNKEDKKDEETKQEEKVELKEVSLDDALVKEASMFNVTEFCGGPLFDFKNSSTKIEDMSDGLKMNMVIFRYMSSIISTMESDDPNYTFDLKVSTLDRYFKDLSFVDKEAANKNKTTIYPTEYTLKDGVLKFRGYPTGCEGVHEGYVSQLVSAKKDDKQLILDYAYYYQTYDYDNDIMSLYYKKGDKSPAETNVKVNEETYENIINPDLYDHYQLIIDISEGKLRLTEVVYVTKK